MRSNSGVEFKSQPDGTGFKDNGERKKETNIEKAESVIEGVIEEQDQFKPLPGVKPYDGRRILTVRAVATGICLGSIINCSNLYLGLMTGFGADATLFASIFGYAICKALEKSKVPFLSGDFGPHENNIIQAAALGCIGIGFMVMSGVPAMYQLHLLGPTPQSDFGRMICFALVAGFWGLGFTVPLRNLFILRLARQLSLYFPLGTASAITIQTLHSIEGSTGQARQHVKAISISFIFSLIWSVATSYAPGILYTWNPLWWIFKWGGRSVISAISWGWFSWSWSPSMIGIGALIDLNAASSYLLGTVLAWGVVGPIIVHKGAAVGIPYAPDYPELLTYNAFIPTQFSTTPSPRYWMLWPATFMMLGVSLTTILLEAKNFARMAKYGIFDVQARFPRRRDASAGSEKVLKKGEIAGEIADPVAPEYQVRWWEWSSVTLVSVIFALVALKYVFGIPPALNLLNLALGFMWSFVVIQVYGASGTTPITTVAKGSQFITGGILRHEIQQRGYESVARINLAGCVISSAAAQQAGELCQDFRTGFLLGTPARPQWHAQMIGTFVAVFLSPAIFLLFAKAFPCILNAEATTCQFTLPAVTSWRVVTQAIFMDIFPISQSSWIFSILMTLLGMGSVALKRYLVGHKNLSAFQVWVPNMSLVGLAMTIPGSSVTLTVTIGAVAAHLWKRYSPRTHERFLYAVAAGGVAGEGVGYVVLSILQIAGVAGVGTSLGCVAEIC
ncbi:putative metal-nicotianamine transporter YSL7 [Colletotrichum fructicola]|nr:putative metal-nicotianamine transporter YSL7 [Colletotrichum fructicola]KAF5499435.1 putative metal-nicotianamine transporter YSL7 [Colletotrichum fructicola]